MYYLLIVVILLVLIYFYFMNAENNNDKPIIYFLGQYSTYPAFEDYVRSLIYKLKENNISYKVFTDLTYDDSFFNNSKKNIIKIFENKILFRIKNLFKNCLNNY